MAITRAGNVIRLDATGSIPGIVIICDIMFVAGASGTVVVTAGQTGSGNTVWEADMDMCCKVPIRLTEGLTATFGGTGGVLYLYTK